MTGETDFPTIEFAQFDWLRRSGVPVEALIALMPLRHAIGVRAEDGHFDPDRSGADFLVFEQPGDLVFWQPRTGELATWCGRAFALGEDQITDATTYAFDKRLNIYASPLDWLRARCSGIVVVDWPKSFDRLRDAPRIALAETVAPQYRRYMKPARLPDVVVVTADGMAVAA